MSNNPDIRRLQDMVELGTPLSDKDARTLFRLYQVALASALSRRDKITLLRQKMKQLRYILKVIASDNPRGLDPRELARLQLIEDRKPRPKDGEE